MVVELRVRLRHHGCYSERLPLGVSVTHLSGDAKQCLCVIAGATAEARETTLRSMASFLGSDPHRLDASPERLLVRCECPTKGILPRLLSSGVSIIWPVLHTEGWEHFHLLADDAETTERALQVLEANGEAHVDRILTAALDSFGANVWLTQIADRLPAQQLHILRTAIEQGYYERPRRTTLARIARTTGITRSTAQEHLQKAEREVMDKLARPLLKLARVTEPQSRPKPRSKRSRPTATKK